MDVLITPRKVTISIEQAKKDGLLKLVDGAEGPGRKRVNGTTYESRLFGEGWSLVEDYLVKMIPMPLLVETAHEDGGVPKVGNPNLDDMCVAITDLIEKHHIPADELAKILNNGLYLYLNAKGKPKATITVADMNKLFGEKADDATKLAYVNTFIKDGGASFLKEWYAKNA